MEQPKPTRITAHAQRLLDVIRNPQQTVDKFNAEKPDGMYVYAMVDSQGWMPRGLIAYGLGKKRLNPYDISLLELLEKNGWIESFPPSSDSPHGYVWMYRLGRPPAHG